MKIHSESLRILTVILCMLASSASIAQNKQPRPGEALQKRNTFIRVSTTNKVSGNNMQIPDNEPTNKTYFPEKSQANVAENGDLNGPFVIYDESLDSILWLLEKLSGKSILRGDGLNEKLKFTFVSKGKIDRDESITAFKSMLMLKGVAIIPINENLLKAVPNTNVSTHIPEFLNCKANDLPPTQDFFTKFFELKHVNVDDVEGKLKAILSGNNASSVETLPKSNALMVTDSLVNLQRVEMYLEKVDESSLEVSFIEVKNTTAAALKDKIGTLPLVELKNLKVDIDARTNTLIVIGSKEAIEFVEKFVKRLDKVTESRLKSETVYIRQCEAVKVVEVIDKIVSGQKQRKENKKISSVSSEKSSKTTERETPTSVPSESQGKSEKIAKEVNSTPPPLPSGDTTIANSQEDSFSDVELSDYVQVVPDERSNAVIIYGTDNDISQIKNIIETMDIVLLQVKIDVIITEVSLSSDQVSGLSSFGINYGAEKVSGFSGNTQTYKLTDSSSPAFSISASESSFSAIFDVARQNQNVKVLSSPTIVTMHSKEGEVNISQSVPVITSSMNDISSVTTTRSSVDYRDIGIKLLVKPLVRKDGAIELDIDQSVDSISGYTTIDNNQQPLISKRRARSFVSVRSNEVVVMAGLQQVDTAEMDGDVWLLSDIPLIGEFFKPSKNEGKRRELIIFIRPTIIESKPIEKALVDEGVDSSEAKFEIKNFMRTGDFYPNGELEKKSEEFERNRPYNKAVNSPLKFIRGKRR